MKKQKKNIIGDDVQEFIPLSINVPATSNTPAYAITQKEEPTAPASVMAPAPIYAPTLFPAQTAAQVKSNNKVIERNVALLAIGGITVASAGGALLWRKDRGFGFLIGLLFVGPIMGGAAVGLYLGAKAK